MPDVTSQTRGPARPFSETPLSGRADYTLGTLSGRRNGLQESTHVRLVVEPSPGIAARELGCGLSIVASYGFLPYPLFRGGPPLCFHTRLVPEALGVPRNLDASPCYNRRKQSMCCNKTRPS